MKERQYLDRTETVLNRWRILSRKVSTVGRFWNDLQGKYEFPRMRKISQGARTWMGKHKTLARFFILAAILAVMFFREPSFFLSPRLWAEEGRDYFGNAYRYAHTELWYRGLSFLYAGYFSLWPNIATTVAANCVSLENVPYVTLLFSVTVQLIPFAIVLWSISAFWQSMDRKTAGILILLFAPISGEVWVSTILSQVFFAITTFLLLLEDAPVTALRRWIYRVLLLLGGLTGPISGILSPFFLHEAYREKSKERWIQTIVLATCAAIQTYIMFFMSYRGTHSVFDIPAYILSLGTQSVGTVLLGRGGGKGVANVFLDAYDQSGYVCAAGVFVCSFVVGLILFFLSRGIPARERRILIGVYIFLTIISFYGAIGEEKRHLITVGPGARYFYASNVILLLLVLARIRKPVRLGSLTATVMLILSITLGMLDYKRTLIQNNRWPQWKAEVQAWRKDPLRKVAVWPPNRKITLQKWDAQEIPLPQQLISSNPKESGKNSAVLR